MTGDPGVQAFLAEQRSVFHASLLADGILSVTGGVASNADSSSKLSKALAGHVATALKVETERERLAGQTAGGGFEQACTTFLQATFPRLGHLRPGDWSVAKLTTRGKTSGVAQFEQYAHLIRYGSKSGHEIF